MSFVGWLIAENCNVIILFCDETMDFFVLSNFVVFPCAISADKYLTQSMQFKTQSVLCLKAQSQKYGFCSGQLHFCREIGIFLSLRWRSLLRKTQTVAASVNQSIQMIPMWRSLMHSLFKKQNIFVNVMKCTLNEDG